MVQCYYEKTNPIYTKEDVIKDYLLLVAVYILRVNKYSYSIKKTFLQYLREHALLKVSFDDYDIYELLFNDSYLLDFIKSSIPINRNLLNNFAIYEFLCQQNMLFPLIFDSIGLFCSFFKIRNKEEKWSIEIGHSDNKTNEIIEEAFEKGRKLIVKDFDNELLAIIMPILIWKKEKVIKRMMEIFYLNNTQSYEMDESYIPESNEINFNGKIRKVHPEFSLILVLTENNDFLSRSLLNYVIIINNDLGDNDMWNETLLDLIIKKFSFSKEENNKVLSKIFEEKLNNNLAQEYQKFLKLMKNLNMNSVTLEVIFFFFE